MSKAHIYRDAEFLYIEQGDGTVMIKTDDIPAFIAEVCMSADPEFLTRLIQTNPTGDVFPHGFTLRINATSNIGEAIK